MHLVPISYICKHTKAGRLALYPKLAHSFSLHRKGKGQNNLITLQPPICIAIAASSMAKGAGKEDWEKWMQRDLSHEGCEESSQCREWDA